jgi:hypothetical protein
MYTSRAPLRFITHLSSPNLISVFAAVAVATGLPVMIARSGYDGDKSTFYYTQRLAGTLFVPLSKKK